MALRFGIQAAPELRTTDQALPPLLWVWSRRAVLLMPRVLLERLSADELDTVFAHELAHLRRRDHWVRLLELVAQGAYWWLPTVRWARHEMRQAEELCCDGWVVRHLPSSTKPYAAALLATLDYLAEGPRAVPVPASGFGPHRPLRHRFLLLLDGRTAHRMAWRHWASAAVIGALALPWVARPVAAHAGADEAPAPHAAAASRPGAWRPIFVGEHRAVLAARFHRGQAAVAPEDLPDHVKAAVHDVLQQAARRRAGQATGGAPFTVQVHVFSMEHMQFIDLRPLGPVHGQAAPTDDPADDPAAKD
jgi:hypothetical protein